MTELNREIVHEIRKLDCDNNIKSFLETMLQYELDLKDNEVGDSKKAIGADYKKSITDFTKEWSVDDGVIWWKCFMIQTIKMQNIFDAANGDLDYTRAS